MMGPMAPGFNPLMQHFLGVLQRPPQPAPMPMGGPGSMGEGGATPVGPRMGPARGPERPMQPRSLPSLSSGYGGSVFDTQQGTGPGMDPGILGRLGGRQQYGSF